MPEILNWTWSEGQRAGTGDLRRYSRTWRRPSDQWVGGDSRKRAAQQFQLDLADMDARHHLTFDTYEIGKLSLDAYLDRIVFYQPRDFSRDDFKTFMFEQSQPYPEMIELVRRTKERNRLNWRW